MGNNQSNEKTRKRIVCVEPKLKEKVKLFDYKVLRKEKHEGCNFIRFYLDGYVTYKDGDYKYIYFANRSAFNNEEYMKFCLRRLDLNYIRNYNHTKTFDMEEVGDVMGKTKPRYEEGDSSETNVQGDGNIISSTGELCKEIGEGRVMHSDAMEQARFFDQTQAGHLEPPK